MRELFAVELRGGGRSTNSEAGLLVDQWIERHLDDTQTPTTVDDVSHIEDASFEESTLDGSRLVVLEQTDTLKSLIWRSEVALGPPEQDLLATIRVGVSSAGSSALAPLQYEFSSQAIVRTLLREAVIADAGVRFHPDPVELSQSDVARLVQWLENEARERPVILVSRQGGTSEMLVDPRTLAREVAGLAHVRILSSPQASWALTDEIGNSLSVWDGAVRIYFPGFHRTDDTRQHRTWYPRNVGEGLVPRVRSWLGSIASSTTPEHPVHVALRTERSARLRDAIEAQDTQWIEEEFDRMAKIEQSYATDVAELKAQITSLERQVEDRDDELQALHQNFAEVASAHVTTAEISSSPTGEVTSVSQAMDAIEALTQNPVYAGRVALTAKALESGRSFASYHRPAEMLRAVQSVLEAGSLYNENLLGEPPMEFFKRRGFGYAKTPSPHLKVDESTSPDQCLRIYWTEDSEARRWTITSIGPHS